MMKGRKLLEKMRANPRGWTAREIDSVYSAYGFERWEGAKHTRYKHPKLPGVFPTVTRSSGEIAAGYAVTAVELIDRLNRSNKEEDNEEE
jgi:hypothetical protein